MNDKYDIIDRPAAANALRKLADRLENEDIRITSMEHEVYYTRNSSEWLRVKWEKTETE